MVLFSVEEVKQRHAEAVKDKQLTKNQKKRQRKKAKKKEQQYSKEPARINVNGVANESKVDTAFTTGVDNGSTTVNVNTYVNEKGEQKKTEIKEMKSFTPGSSKFTVDELFRFFQLVCFSFLALIAVDQEFKPWTLFVTLALSVIVYQYRGSNRI